MKKNGLIALLSILVLSLMLSGCTVTESQKVMMDQNQKKMDEAAKLMKTVPVPQLNYSLERQNISERLITTNDPAMLMWIYPMSAGRVIGRFPVRGKVTSGSKRLTATQQLIPFSQKANSDSSTVEYHLTDAPDEMGTYGSSGDYIFWFDPAGRYQQFKGDYFESQVPYQIEKGFGTIQSEVDATEEAKRAQYQKDIKDNPIKVIIEPAPTPTPTKPAEGAKK